MRVAVRKGCKPFGYKVIDAQSAGTGRDFLVKIWHLIASAPLSIGILHEAIPHKSQENIFYEIGVAQALGKETVIIKSPTVKIPSDFVRSEYLDFDKKFPTRFNAYIKSIHAQANLYEKLSDQLDTNPILALDYLKRAYLIKGDKKLRNKVKNIVDGAGLEKRAANSVELIAASF